MGTIWLNGRTGGYPNVVDVLRAGGVNVATYSGWENRSRSSGGFTGLWGIVVHHTASNTTPANDLSYMVNGPDNPISNGLLDRDGTFTIIAGGASNHAGKGGGSSDGGGTPWVTTRGTIPANSANSYAFGIEAANAGTGQSWPKAQQDAYVKMVRALCNGYGLDPKRDVRAHQEWSPPRKCDPTGPSRFAQPVGRGKGCNGADLWDMNIFRTEVASGTSPLPPIPEDDMPRLSNPLLQGTGKDGSLPGAVYMTDGLLCYYWWIPNETTLKDVQYTLRVNGLSDQIQTVDNLAAFGVLTGPKPGS